MVAKTNRGLVQIVEHESHKLTVVDASTTPATILCRVGFSGNSSGLQNRKSGVRVPHPVPFCGINSVVECFLAKENVTGSSPVFRSILAT